MKPQQLLVFEAIIVNVWSLKGSIKGTEKVSKDIPISKTACISITK